MVSNQNLTGQTLSITEPTNLCAAITVQNISHYSQAMDTPKVSGTLRTFIPPFTRNESTTSIFQGSYNLTNINTMPEICQFLQAMAIPIELLDTDPVDIVISTLNIQKSFKKFPDKTPSSPSGCHMTHYKLLANDKGLSHILARPSHCLFNMASLLLNGAQLSNSCWRKNHEILSSPNSE